MDPIILIIICIISLLISLACIVGAVFVYKVYISTSSFKEFMETVKTQGYLKSLFRFDKLISPKILQFFYGLNALGVIGSGLILLIVALILGITHFDFRLIIGGILGSVILIVVGEVFLRIGYEFAMLLFKMNESLQVLKDVQVSRGFVEVETDDRMATEAISDTFQSIKNTVKGAQPAAQEMKFCPNCGTQNRTNAKFCKGCGASL